MAGPPIQNETLIPSRLKIQRAEEHIRELETVLRDHAQSDPHRLVCEFKESPPIVSVLGTMPGFMAYHYRVDTLSPLPDKVSLIFGDVVHNLRAALDLFAYDLIVENGGSEKFTGFPFQEEPGNFEAALRNGPISVVPEKVKDLLRTEIQPYRSGNGRNLWAMNKLDVIDKHRLLLATEVITALHGGGRAASGGLRLIGYKIGNRHPSGYLLISGDRLILDDDARIAFEVVVAEREYFTDEPLVSTLRELAAETRLAIKRLEETLFGTAGGP